MSTEELKALPNVGDVLVTHLQAVGISTPDELREAGTQEVFLRIRAGVDPGACLHELYGIEGAVQGISKKQLSDASRKELKAFFDGLE